MHIRKIQHQQYYYFPASTPIYTVKLKQREPSHLMPMMLD